MSNALAVRRTAADSQAKQNAASSTHVKRYWPGRAPDWYDKDKAGEAEEESEEEEKGAEPEDEPAVTAVAAPVVLKKVHFCPPHMFHPLHQQRASLRHASIHGHIDVAILTSISSQQFPPYLKPSLTMFSC